MRRMCGVAHCRARGTYAHYPDCTPRSRANSHPSSSSTPSLHAAHQKCRCVYNPCSLDSSCLLPTAYYSAIFSLTRGPVTTRASLERDPHGIPLLTPLAKLSATIRTPRSTFKSTHPRPPAADTPNRLHCLPTTSTLLTRRYSTLYVLPHGIRSVSFVFGTSILLLVFSLFLYLGSTRRDPGVAAFGAE